VQPAAPGASTAAATKPAPRLVTNTEQRESSTPAGGARSTVPAARKGCRTGRAAAVPRLRVESTIRRRAARPNRTLNCVRNVMPSESQRRNAESGASLGCEHGPSPLRRAPSRVQTHFHDNDESSQAGVLISKMIQPA
jgi:hypothetical protein